MRGRSPRRPPTSPADLRPTSSDRRSPPHSDGAEADTLSAILIDGAAISRVELEPEDFYDPRHRCVFEAMKNLQARAKPVDDVGLLEEELERMGKLAAIGGLAFLSELFRHNVTADNVEHYVEIVRDKSDARRLIITASEIAAKGFADYGTIDEFYSEAWRAIAGTTDARRRADSFRRVGAVVQEARIEAMKRADARASGSPIDEFVPTGLCHLDAGLGGGLPVGVVTVEGGRPSDGKSALAKTIAWKVAQRGIGVHVFSLEDRASVYGERILAEGAKISGTLIRLGELDPEKHGPLLRDVERRVADLKWGIDDRASLSSAQIAMAVRRRRAELGTRLVVVDYAQLGEEPDVPSELETAALNAFIRGMVRLAREEGVALLLLSQLNRQNVRDGHRRPRCDDLRQSGVLEQAARCVFFPHTVRNAKGKPTGTHEIVVGKNTSGQRDIVIPMHWDGPTTTYSCPDTQPGLFSRVPDEPPPMDAPPHGDEDAPF